MSTPAVTPPVDSSMAGSPEFQASQQGISSPQDNGVANGLAGGTPPIASTNQPPAPKSDEGDLYQMILDQIHKESGEPAEAKKPSLAKAIIAGALLGMAKGAGAGPGPNHLGKAAAEGVQAGMDYVNHYGDEDQKAKDRQAINTARSVESAIQLLRLKQMQGQQSKEDADSGVEQDQWMDGEEGATGLNEKDAAAFMKQHVNEGWSLKRTGSVKNQHGQWENSYTAVKLPAQDITDDKGELTDFAKKVVDYGLAPAKAYQNLQGTPGQKESSGSYSATLHRQIEQADTLEDEVQKVGGQVDVKDALKKGDITWADIRAYANAAGGGHQTPHDRISALLGNATTAASGKRLEALFGQDRLNDSFMADRLSNPGEGKPMTKEENDSIERMRGNAQWRQLHPKTAAIADQKHAQEEADKNPAVDEGQRKTVIDGINGMEGISPAQKKAFVTQLQGAKTQKEFDTTRNEVNTRASAILGKPPANPDAKEKGNLYYAELNGKQVAGSASELKAAGVSDDDLIKVEGAEKEKIINARTLDHQFDKAEQLVNQLDKEGKLGIIASRWNELKRGRVGDGDPEFTRLMTQMGLNETALMQVHVGARGSSQLMEHFHDLADAGKMDAASIKAAISQEHEYVKDKAMRAANAAPKKKFDPSGLPKAN